ncbi:hypothetical protein C8R43DRAFT_961257 [Mycena crocata]|nr:hypothetical protein C8R43DRAFT_961257 [Mycena crocata]
MPSPLTASHVRMNRAITALTGAVETLGVISKNVKGPFLQAIVNTGQSLLSMMQTVQKNKDDCTWLMEQACSLVYAVISVHVECEVRLDLPPSTLNQLGKATETLHKIHSFVEAQQEKSKIKWFLKQGEMNILFNACKTGLQQVLDDFEFDTTLLKEINEMQKYAQYKHQEVLQMIMELEDDTNSDQVSLINEAFYSSHNSSASISLLPSKPKIFHGRESELSDILELLEKKAPRIAILGPGGMGKTTLAKAVLHEPEIQEKFGQHRYFVACDAVSTKAELVSLVGIHLGLKPEKDLIRPIIRFLSSNPACLLILDNLETVWDPLESRRDVEEFLSLLTDVEQMALLVDSTQL